MVMSDYADSWYGHSIQVDLEPCPRLEGQHRADVCVIGGGVTGCSAALHLARRGYRVKLLEAKRIAWGASGRAGGHVLPGLGTGMDTVAKGIGKEAARSVWDMSLEAVQQVDDLVREYAIPCDLRWGYVHTAIRQRHMKMYRAWAEQMAREYGYHDMELLDGPQVRERVRSDYYIGGIHEPRAGRLHPMNYTLGLARAAQSHGAEFHEDSAVTRIDSGDPARVHTEHGQVGADFVVLACNAYLDELDPALRSKIMPVGNYVIATEPLNDERVRQSLPTNEAVSDANFVLDYYHLSADQRLLYGGQVSYNGREPRNLRQRMEAKMTRIFPALAGVQVEYIWGGWVGITLNRAPHFGRVGGNVYFAHGYSGQGMAMGGMAGKLMAEAIGGQAERFDVFARMPHRDFPGGRHLRTPLLVLATNFYRMRDLI
jgi:gamma-glutamylputrescine oxidase